MNSSLENNLKQLVHEGRTSDALATLLEASRPNKQVHDAIQVVLGEFNDLTAQRLRGAMEETEASLRLNIIHNKILIALGSFDSQGNPLPGTAVQEQGLTPSSLSSLGLYLLGGALLLAFLGYVLQTTFPDLGGGKFGFMVMIVGYYIGLAGLFVLGIWLLARVLVQVKGK